MFRSRWAKVVRAVGIALGLIVFACYLLFEGETGGIPWYGFYMHPALILVVPVTLLFAVSFWIAYRQDKAGKK
ncbi:MAG: hypothetical protein EHM23_28710 [Acidobacteria bacterium]|nr:MAG: hypothetical protein EHM23_28710 [Acidobacteriota bacterium]